LVDKKSTRTVARRIMIQRKKNAEYEQKHYQIR